MDNGIANGPATGLIRPIEPQDFRVEFLDICVRSARGRPDRGVSLSSPESVGQTSFRCKAFLGSNLPDWPKEPIQLLTQSLVVWGLNLLVNNRFGACRRLESQAAA